MPKYRQAPKSEMDSHRELLDSLMGVNRNLDRAEDHVSDFRDDRVCKFFLTGMCPNEMFVNTKADEGPCQKLHSEVLKMDFEKHGDPHMFDSYIEKEFSLKIGDADRAIKKARARVEEDKSNPEINPDINPDIMRIHAEMSKVIVEAEEAGIAGDVDKAQELVFDYLKQLEKEKTVVMNQIRDNRQKRAGGPDKKLRVCDICGSYLSVFDTDVRLADHFVGKQHIGFKVMRDKVEEIRARLGYRDRDRDNRDNRDRDRDRGDRDRDRDRYYRGGSSRDYRDRDRDSSRDRRDDSKDYRNDGRSRGRGYQSSYKHSGHRSSSRDRERDRGSTSRDRDHSSRRSGRRW